MIINRKPEVLSFMTQPEQLAPVLSNSWAEMLAYGSTTFAIYNEDFMKPTVQNGGIHR